MASTPQNAAPVVAAILAVGFGSGLWPLSRQQMPKHFLCLDGKLSPREATIAHLDHINRQQASLIVTNEEHVRGKAFTPLQSYAKLHASVARNNAPPIGPAAAR